MPEVLDKWLFGVPLGGILLAFIRLFRPKLEQLSFLGINGVTWAIAVAAGVMGGLVGYGDWIAINYPIVVSIVQVAGAILVPFFIVLGFWGDIVAGAKAVRNRVLYFNPEGFVAELVITED